MEHSSPVTVKDKYGGKELIWSALSCFIVPLISFLAFQIPAHSSNYTTEHRLDLGWRFCSTTLPSYCKLYVVHTYICTGAYSMLHLAWAWASSEWKFRTTFSSHSSNSTGTGSYLQIKWCAFSTNTYTHIFAYSNLSTTVIPISSKLS